MNAVLYKINRKTKITLVALAVFNLYIFFNIPFLGLLTIMLLFFVGIITSSIQLAFFLSVDDVDATFSSRMLALCTGIIMTCLLMLTNYNALTDMTQLTDYTGMGTKIVFNQTVISTLSEYQKGDPARVMLKQFFLTSPHSTVFVWDKVAQRAKYLSDMYTAQELPARAAAPAYGFLHATRTVMRNVINSRTNKIHENSSIAEFIKLRRKGYTVRYANTIVHRVSAIVNGKSAILNNVSEYNKLLQSISSAKNPAVKMATVAEMAKQLDIKTNLPALIDANLGMGLTSSAILNANLLAPHNAK